MKKFYTTIREALEDLRPLDPIIKTYGGKFAIIKVALETPKGEPRKYLHYNYVMQLVKNKIYGTCPDYMLNNEIKRVAELPNVERICIDKIINGHKVCQKYWKDNRKHKQLFRRLAWFVFEDKQGNLK